MHTPEMLDRLRRTGRMRWVGAAAGWIAQHDDVVQALSQDGFEECKCAEARDPHCHACGGVWQGLNRSTGAVVSAVWVESDARPHLVFIDIDGEPLQDA